MTFMNADAEEDVFVAMAPGQEANDKAGIPLVMKLKKSLYGLQQSPKNLLCRTEVELTIIGFRPRKSDPCVYIYKDEINFVILTLDLDGILFISASKTLLNILKKQPMDRFKTADVSRTLGMNVPCDRDKGAIAISQEDYTENVGHRYDKEVCNPAYTPGVGPELSLNQPEEKLLNKWNRHHQIVTGTMMYLAQLTRYDILYAANQLARAMPQPAKAHMGASKHLVRYLDYSVPYKQGSFRLAAFADANWDNTTRRRSTATSFGGMPS